MKKIIKRIFIYNFLFIISPLGIFANDQSVVIGLEMGGGSFSTVDETRKAGWACGICPDTTNVGTLNMFAEWYLFDSLGIGYRGTSATGGWETIGGSTKYTYKWTSTNTLITGNWIFWGETDYTRAGAIIGVGSSKYEFNYKAESPSSTTELPFETSGGVSMFGLFLDWGGESFGARLGYDSVSTTLDPLVINNASLQADGSYSGAYLGLRWAW